MGGYITIGMRSHEGDVKSALFYTNHLQEFVLDDNIAHGRESYVSDRIDQMVADEDYGPFPLAPYGYGLRFYDFQSKAIVDSQEYGDPLGIEFEMLVASMIADDGRFERLVPFIGGMSQWSRREDGGFFKKKKKIEPVCDVDGLWEALGFNGLPGKFDFATLDIRLPDWKVTSYRRDLSGTEVMQAHLRRLGVLKRSDNEAWLEYIDLRRVEAQRSPF